MVTVIATPRMSINTWIVVLECAGSILTYFMSKGRMVPKKIDDATMMTRDAVMANVSATGVRNTAALMQPAMPRTALSQKPA